VKICEKVLQIERQEVEATKLHNGASRNLYLSYILGDNIR